MKNYFTSSFIVKHEFVCFCTFAIVIFSIVISIAMCSHVSLSDQVLINAINANNSDTFLKDTTINNTTYPLMQDSKYGKYVVVAVHQEKGGRKYYFNTKH